MWGSGLLFLLELRVEPRVSQAHSLSVYLKHKNGNLKHSKRKKQVAQKVNCQNHPRSVKQRRCGAYPVRCVAGTVFT